MWHPKQVAATRKRAGAHEVIRTFGAARAYLLRAAELTRLGDEVFMLDVDEVAAVLGL